MFLFQFLRQLDIKLLESFELCTGISLTSLARQQALLPKRYCGLGLQKSSKLGIPILQLNGCLLHTRIELSSVEREVARTLFQGFLDNTNVTSDLSGDPQLPDPTKNNVRWPVPIMKQGHLVFCLCLIGLREAAAMPLTLQCGLVVSLFGMGVLSQLGCAYGTMQIGHN